MKILLGNAACDDDNDDDDDDAYPKKVTK